MYISICSFLSVHVHVFRFHSTVLSLVEIIVLFSICGICFFVFRKFVFVFNFDLVFWLFGYLLLVNVKCTNELI